LVEREQVVVNDYLRVLLGQYFERRLGGNLLLISLFREAFPLVRLAPGLDESPWSRASESGIRFRAAAAGRVVDGGRLLERLLAGASAAEAYDEAVAELDEPPVGDGEVRQNGRLRAEIQDKMARAGARMLRWYLGLYSQPANPALEQVPPPRQDNPAWRDDRMEYEFSVSAPYEEGREFVLDAHEYHDGSLDWHAFTLDPRPDATLGPRGPGEVVAGSETKTILAIPAPVEVAGMPNERWWDFEDRQINLGTVDVSKTELGKLIFLQFALVQSNDWHLIPIPLQPGSLLRVESLRVMDSFSISHHIEPAAEPDWALYTLARRPRQAAGPSFEHNLFFLPPSFPHVQESAPIEEVLFLRDEMANTVFAVERALPDEIGRPLSGYNLFLARQRRARQLARTAALAVGRILEEIPDTLTAESWVDLRRRLASVVQWQQIDSILSDLSVDGPPATEAELAAARRQLRQAGERVREVLVNRFLAEGGNPRDMGPLPAADEAAVSLPRYKLFGTVPENWIPFAPVPVPGQPGQVMLRRYAIPDLRQVDAASGRPARIRARGRILSPEKRPFYLFEEEVPRIGTRIVRTVQYGRSRDGRSHFWVGRRKWPGRGEGSSGLRFDFLRPPSA
jgi:hypothetical protein